MMMRLHLLTLVAFLCANILGASFTYGQFDDFAGFGSDSSDFGRFGGGRVEYSEPITLTPLSQAEESQRDAMVKMLDRPVSLAEREWILEDLLASIERQLDIEIVPDLAAFREMGIDPELEPIDIPFCCKRLPARTVLEYAFSGPGLTWLVEGGLFIVTTMNKAESLQIAIKYNVTDLVPAEEIGEDFDGGYFIDLITETVDPESWDTWGGPGRIEAASVNGSAYVTVQQSRHVLDNVEALLAELRRLNVLQSERPHPPWVDEDVVFMRRLQTQMVVDYSGTPLKYFAEDLYESIRAPVFFDVSALWELGIDPDIEPIDYGVKTMSVRASLDVILSDLGLAYAWREDALWITSIDALDDWEFMGARTYDVSNILNDEGDVGSLIDLITETIEPDSWDSWGGPGTISEAELKRGCFFVIRQKWDIHRSIEQFLSELEMVSFGETVEDDPQWPSIVSEVESERARSARNYYDSRRERASRPPVVSPPESRTESPRQPSEGSANPFGVGESGGIDPFALTP